MTHTPTLLNSRTICVDDKNAQKSALIIHGIMGSSRNWIGFSRSLARQHPDWRFVLVDLRGHGDSHPTDPPHSINNAALDIVHLCQTKKIHPSAIVGHSFGGKVALALSQLDLPHLREVWSLDSPPGSGAPESSLDVIAVLKAIRALKMPLETRAEIVPYFMDLGFGPAIANWMTTNLRHQNGGYRWHFDVDAVQLLMRDYFQLDLWHTVGKNPSIVYHELIAANSDRWTATDRAILKSRQSQNVIAHTLANSGHWVHVDNPTGLIELLGHTLRSQRGV